MMASSELIPYPGFLSQWMDALERILALGSWLWFIY